MKKAKFVIFLAIISLFISLGFTINEKDPKLKKIFNGKDLDGWVAPEGNIWWKAEKGILTAKSDPDKKKSILWTKEEYKDFIIQLDFKMVKGTMDSGIFLRTETEQIKIGESKSLKRDMTGSTFISGKGYAKEAIKAKELLKLNNWNTMKVKVVRGLYTIWLNGEQVCVYESDSAVEKGPVGLLLHPGREMQIEFKNIKLAALL